MVDGKPLCRTDTPNPANTREPKPQPYVELLGLQPTLPCIFMVYGWASCDSEKYGNELRDVIQFTYSVHTGL